MKKKIKVNKNFFKSLNFKVEVPKLICAIVKNKNMNQKYKVFIVDLLLTLEEKQDEFEKEFGKPSKLLVELQEQVIEELMPKKGLKSS